MKRCVFMEESGLAKGWHLSCEGLGSIGRPFAQGWQTVCTACQVAHNERVCAMLLCAYAVAGRLPCGFSGTSGRQRERVAVPFSFGAAACAAHAMHRTKGKRMRVSGDKKDGNVGFC